MKRVTRGEDWSRRINGTGAGAGAGIGAAEAKVAKARMERTEKNWNCIVVIV